MGAQGPMITAVPTSLRPASLWMNKDTFLVRGPVIWICSLATTTLLSPQSGKSDNWNPHSNRGLSWVELWPSCLCCRADTKIQCVRVIFYAVKLSLTDYHHGVLMWCASVHKIYSWLDGLQMLTLPMESLQWRFALRGLIMELMTVTGVWLNPCTASRGGSGVLAVINTW